MDIGGGRSPSEPIGARKSAGQGVNEEGHVVRVDRWEDVGEIVA
jgi:hypothetical protein